MLAGNYQELWHTIGNFYNYLKLGPHIDINEAFTSFDETRIWCKIAGWTDGGDGKYPTGLE